MKVNEDSKIVPKGWRTAVNVSAGIILLILGCILAEANGIYATYANVSGTFFIFVMSVAIVLILIGVSGFWIIVPAFQKWWHTKKRWLVWVFLAIGFILVPLLLYLIFWLLVFSNL
ncbi:MAG TPA: hypothetical protein VMA75_04595 [Candidatus Paceibacterota bacterium]|nr:hypothetical protein [Candidatus Paceibacterota bacterium]